MAGFNFQNNVLPTTPILTKKVDVSKTATPTATPVPYRYDFSAPSYFPQSFKFKKGNWASVYTEPTRPVPGSPQYAWANRTKAEELKSYEPSVAKKPVPYKLSPNPMDILAGGTAFGAQQKNTAMSTPATTSSEKSETNPFVAIGLSLASAAVDTAAKAVESIAAYISNQSNIKVGKNISGVMPTVPLSTLAPTKATREAALKEENIYNQKSFDAFSGTDLGNPILTGTYKGIEGLRKPIVTQLNKSADLQNQPDWAQTVANVVGSIPYTLISRIPAGVGLLLNYGTSTMQAVEQKVAESGVPLSSLTPKQKLDIMDYATGSAVVNAGTEQIFPAGKGMLSLGKAIASHVVKDIAKEIVKFVAKNVAQEATEEGLSYIGTGLVAMVTTNPIKSILATDTTDPNETLFGLTSGTALVNLQDLGVTMYTAGLSALLFSGAGLGGSYIGSKTKNTYSNFKNTQKAYDKFKDTPSTEMKPENLQEIVVALNADAAVPENAAVIQQQAKIALVRTEVNMPVNEQISGLQTILQEVYSDDTSTMTPEQVVTHKEYVTALEEKIAELDGQETVVTANGSKYSVVQMESSIQKGEAWISDRKTELASETNPNERLSLQDDINTATEQVNQRKQLLQQATQAPLSSAEMLANLQASRMPVKAQTTQNVESPANVANVAQTVAQEAQGAFPDVQTREAASVAEKTAEVKPIAPKPTLEQAQKAYAETIKKAAPNIAFDKAYEADVRKSGFTRKEADKAVTDAAVKYKSVAAVEDAITTMKQDMLKLSSLDEKIRSGEIIKMDLQAFALKKILSSFTDIPLGNRLHSFLDSFRRIAQVGSPKDMAKFIQDNMIEDDLTYRKMANSEEVAKSDTLIEKEGDLGLKRVYDDFMSSTPDTMLTPDKLVSITRFLDKMVKSDDVEVMAEGFKGLTELSNRLTRAGQFTQSVRAVLDAFISDRQGKKLAKEIDNKSSDPIDKIDLKKAVEDTKNIVGDAVQKSLDNTVGEFESGMDKSDSDAIDEVVPKKESGKKATMEQMLAALIKKDISGRAKKASTADTLALQVLHNIYLEMNPSDKGKVTSVFDTLAKMAANKDKYGNVWDKAKPLVETAIAKENAKREGTDLPQLVVPENYLDRFRDPDFTKRMMDQAIRQVLNYNRTNMKSEARKFYLEGGTGENTINRFVSGLRDKFDDAYGQAMPDETFSYLKSHIVEQFKASLQKSKGDISKAIRKQVESAPSKGVFNKTSRIDKVIDQLTDAVISGALSDNKLSTIWAKKMGLNYISDEMRAQISASIIEIDKIDNEFDRFNAYQDFVNKLGGQIKATNMMKLNAWRRFAMLCSPKTWTRNGISNYAYLPYVRVMQGLTYRIQQTMKLDQQYMDRGQRYLGRGMNLEIDAVVDATLTAARVRTIMEENGKYSFGEHLKREGRIFNSDIAEAVTKAPLYVISTGTLTKNGKHGIPFFGDQGILKTYLTDAFRNKLNALGYKESLSEEVKSEKTAIALKYAKDVALTGTYRAASVISEAITGLKKNVNTDAQISSLVKSGKPADLDLARKRRTELNARNTGVDFAVPFVLTPAAIATEGYRLSPVALGVSLGELLGMKIKHQTKANPDRMARLSKQISKALVGVGGQWLVGAALALSGAITGAPPDSEKEKKEWALEGKTAYSIQTPLGWMSYAWCQPVALGIMGGADIATVIRNGGYNLNAIPGAIAAGFNGVVGATLYGNVIDNLFGGRTDADNVKNFVTGSITQGFPTLLKSLASTFDPYVRDTYSGNVAQVMLYRTLSYIPIASMIQPVKVDIWGNPVKASDAGMNIVGRSALNLISPFTLTEAKTDVVSKEVIRLFNTTGSNSTLPVVVTAAWNKTLDATVDGVEGKYKFSYDLSGQDWVDFQTLMGQRAFSYAKQTIADERYIKASDADKVTYLTKAYAQASDDAKTEYIKDHVKEGLGK